MDVFSRASILPLQDVLELAPHPSSFNMFNIKKDTKRLDKNDQMLVKCWSNYANFENLRTSHLAADHSWDGPGEADQSTGGSQLSKAGLAGATGLLGRCWEDGKRLKNWGLTKTCGIPVGIGLSWLI